MLYVQEKQKTQTAITMISKKKLFTLAVAFVGCHSILLGFILYFLTDFFYKFFFSSEVINLFFVKQSGLFLFLAGLFYLVPLTNLEKLSRVTIVTIISKFCAVLFLFSNARHTPAPFMIYLAGAGDGCMAIALSSTYVLYKKELSIKTLS